MKKWLTLLWSAGSALILAASALAQDGVTRGGAWQPSTLLWAIISTLIFGLLGIVMAILGFKLFDALTPFHLEREICEKQNIAVAILCGAMVLGICIIIAVVVL
jgi:uncharacterized membrane protein YjfL (UPF0719 family)